MSTFELLDAYSAARREILRVYSAEMRALDFGQKQMTIVFRLSISSASMGELAEYSMSDKASTSRTVDSLEKAGLVKRVSDPTDRRVIKIELTVKGRSKAAAAVKMRKIIAKKVNRALEGGERKQLVELMSKLTTHLKNNRT